MDFSSAVSMAYDGNKNSRLKAIRMIRKFLCKMSPSRLDQAIELDVVPAIVNCLGHSNDHNTRLEASWASTIIAAGTSQQTQALVDGGATPILAEHLKSANPVIWHQALWALGNIAADRAEFRDQVIALGVIPQILSLASLKMPPWLFRKLPWFMSNLFAHSLSPASLEQTSVLLPSLKKFLHHDDEEVLTYTLKSFSNFARAGEQRIQVLIDMGVVPLIVELMSHSKKDVHLSACRAVGNITTGNDDQTQVVIDSGALDYFPALLSSTYEEVNATAMWTLSNITAGDEGQIQAVVDSGLVPLILHHLRRDGTRVQEEATWTIEKYTEGGTINQLQYMVQQGAIPILMKLLTGKDLVQVHVATNALSNLMDLTGPNYIILDP